MGKVWGRAESWRRARRAAAEESGRCASARRGRPTPPCSRCGSAGPQLFCCIAFVFRPLVSSRSTRLSGSLPVPDDACPPVSCPPYAPSSARRRPLPSRGLHAAAVSSVVSFFPGSPKRVRAAASTTLVAVPHLPVLSGLGWSCCFDYSVLRFLFSVHLLFVTDGVSAISRCSGCGAHCQR